MGRRKYTEDFKREVGRAAAERDMTLKELGKKFGVHPTLVRNWRIAYGDTSISTGVDEGESYKIHVGFDQRGDDSPWRCRWFIAWQEPFPGTLVGAVGAYLGGGSFGLEMFTAIVEDDELVSLKIDLEDKITGDEIDFASDVPGDLVTIADDAIDLAYEWNDQDVWEESEQLFLLDDMLDSLVADDDMRVYASGWHDKIPQILSLFGSTASPKSSSG